MKFTPMIIREETIIDVPQFLADFIGYAMQLTNKNERASKVVHLNTEDDIIVMMACKRHLNPYEMKDYIDNLTKLNPAAAATVLLKELATAYDSMYEGHIQDSEEIWTISMLDGKIRQVDKSRVINYENFSAFRTKAEAIKAYKVLSKRLEEMFKSYGK